MQKFTDNHIVQYVYSKMGQVNPHAMHLKQSQIANGRQMPAISHPTVPYTFLQQPSLNVSKTRTSTSPTKTVATPLTSSRLLIQQAPSSVYTSMVGTEKNPKMSESRIAVEATSQILINPQLGTTGSSMKRPNEILKQKHVTFESGLQELLLIRENLRSTKQYFSKISPVMNLQLFQIQSAIEAEFQSGIGDQSKLFYHLGHEKKYRITLLKIAEQKEKVVFSIDCLRKKNNVSKQEFINIINISNEARSFTMKLAAEMPVSGWNAILANNNTNLYNQNVAEAQNDQQVVQSFKTLVANLRNTNYHYTQAKEPENIYQSKVFINIQGPNPVNTSAFDFSSQRPSTPRPQTPGRPNSLIS